MQRPRHAYCIPIKIPFQWFQNWFLRDVDINRSPVFLNAFPERSVLELDKYRWNRVSVLRVKRENCSRITACCWGNSRNCVPKQRTQESALFEIGYEGSLFWKISYQSLSNQPATLCCGVVITSIITFCLWFLVAVMKSVLCLVIEQFWHAFPSSIMHSVLCLWACIRNKN